MRKNLAWIIVLIFVLFLLISCTDSVKKILHFAEDIRVEYSKCSACYECINNFQCPEDAIKIDNRTYTVYIDSDKCVGCMKCINQFQCPENAITIKRDLISPAEISNFNAVSNSIGELNIQFIATGDDSTFGRAFRYEFSLKNQNGIEIETDFEVPLPLQAGALEAWTIQDLPENEMLTVQLQAFDEVEQSCESTYQQVLIQGIIPDTIPPAPITDLSVGSVSQNTILLNWTAVGDDSLEGTAQSYIMKISNEEITIQNWEDIDEYEQNLIPQESGSSESIVISDLDASTNYFAAIKVLDDAQNLSFLSNVISETTSDLPDETPPAGINDLQVESTQTEITLSWTSTGDDGFEGTAYEYIIKVHDAPINVSNWDEAETLPNPPTPLPSGSLQSYLYTDVEFGIVYYFAIKVYDDVLNESEISNVVNSTLLEDSIPPATITDLSVDSVSQNTILINWTAVGDDGLEGTAQSYIIKINTEEITIENWDDLPAYEQSVIPQESGALESFVIAGLESSTNYYAAIKVLDEVQNISSLSNVINAYTSEIPDTIPPAAIDDLQAESSEIEIILSWTSTGDDGLEGIAFAYEIKVHDELITEDNWEIADLLPNPPTPLPSGSQQNYSYLEGEPGTVYFFAIKVLDDVLNVSPLSNVINSTLLEDTTPPAQITDLEVGSVSTETIQLNWTAVGDDGLDGTAQSYIIRISTVEISNLNWEFLPEFPQNMIPQAPGTLESIVITELEPSTNYYAAVKAVDDAQNISPLSNVVNETTANLPDYIPPAAIDDLDAEPDQSDIILIWTATGDDGYEGTAYEYEIRYAEIPITEENWDEAELLPNPPIPLPSGSIQNYTFSDGIVGITYYFAIKVYDDVLNVSPISNNATAILEEDLIPPSAITDLSVLEIIPVNLSTIKISWTAPGDDGDEGTASLYEIRYHNTPITELNWQNATLYPDPPEPEIAGTYQTCNVTNLQVGTIYYFAIKAFDENNNAGDISNSPGGKIVYQINHAACRNCNSCINTCSYGAISQGPGYKTIDPDLCTACGTCVPYCNWNLIYRFVVAY